MKFISFITVFILLSCSSENKTEVKQDIEQQDPEQNFRINKVVSDSLYLIKFGNGIQVNWNRNTQRIERDSLLKGQLPYFKENTQELINQITNRTELPFFVCGSKNKIVIGDIAYIVLDRLYDLTFIVGDAFEYPCPYPAGFFEAIDKDREGLKEKIKQYVENAKINPKFPKGTMF